MKTHVITPSTQKLDELLSSIDLPESMLLPIFEEFEIPNGTEYLQIRVPAGFSGDNVYNGRMVMCVVLADYGTLLTPESHPELFNF